MARRILLMLIAVVALTACGSGAERMVRSPGTAPTGISGLPELSELPAPIRSGSLAGPGFFPLDPLAPLSSDGASVAGSELVIDGNAASPAFALYSLQGFKPGVGPTSARLTLNSVTGEYYVAFADYASGVWVFAGPFMGSDTAEIPNAGTPNPADYLSPSGYVYFAVICAKNNAAHLAGVELGLQGGTDAPAPVTFGRYTGMDSPYTFIWTRSTDEMDLDFAGYMVERAPLLTGGFVPLTPAPVKEHYFLDDTITAGAKYRIRVAAVDVSGNQSAWYETSGPNDELSDPVCILKPPATPINAPQFVTFDLSDSFDPLGQTITEYHIILDDGHQATDSNPLITMEIHPGCYAVGASILTADSRYGDDAQPLTAYPQWETAPVVVRDTAAADGPCWSKLQLYRDPATGLLSLCALDSRYPGVSLWREAPAGGFDWALVPDYCWRGQLEPYSSSGGPLFVLHSADGTPAALAEIHGAENADYAQILNTDYPGNIFGTFTGADGQPWVVKLGSSSGVNANDFVAAPVSDLASETLICLGHELFHEASVAQDPATGIVHIAGMSASVAPDYYPFYAEFDPAAGVPVVEQNMDEYFSGTEMEVVPATGDTWMAYYDGVYVYARTRTGGVWQPAVSVDNSDANQACFDLEIGASAPAVLMSVGRPRLYIWDGAAWVLRNETSYTADFAREAALEVVPDSDTFIAATEASTGEIYLGQLNLNGTDAQLDKWVPTSGAGPHLSAAAASDGVHVVMRSVPNINTYHYRSTDGCASFEKLGNLLACNMCDLTATQDGDLYLSTSTGGSASLEYWTGTQFSIFFQPLAPSYFPMLSQVPETKVRWAAPVYSPAKEFNLAYGNSSDGYAMSTQPWTFVDLATGVVGPQALFPRIFCIGDYDYGQRQYSFLGLITIPGAVNTPLYAPLLPPNLAVVDANNNCCNCMSASYGRTSVSGPWTQVYWSGFGEGDAPQRIMVQADGSSTMAPLPGAWDANPSTGMPLRSVQAALANGYTPVCVAAGLLGSPLRLEWSANGAWEELPIPPSMQGMSKYELCIEGTGAWHLFAHDWRNDRILCLSTPELVQ